MSNKRNLLGLSLWSETDTERHATWLELFFDLVFVFAIAELSHFLYSELTWTGIASFAALFIPVWWLWIDFSYYADQFNGNKVYDAIVLGVMFGIIALALSVPEALRGESVQFAIVYSILRAVIVFLYVQAWRFVPQSRELTARYTLSFSVALLLWLISIFVPEPARFFLWGIALLIEISNGPITYLTIRSVPTQKSHMDERFGLFVIIVLGEVIVAVATGVAGTDWQWRSTLAGISSFVTAVSLWWMYFERADESAIDRALRGGKLALARSYVYGYGHIFIFIGIVAAGVGLQLAIEASTGEPFIAQARAVLCGGLAVFLFGLTVVQWAVPGTFPQQMLVVRLLTVLLYGGLILFGGFLPPFAITMLLAVVSLGLVRVDSAYTRFVGATPLEE